MIVGSGSIGQRSSELSVLNDGKQNRFREREARNSALKELKRVASQRLIKERLDAADERRNMNWAASMSQLYENSRVRDYQIQVANQRKIEQEAQRHRIAAEAAEANERARRVQAQRVEEEKARQKESYAKKNQDQEVRRHQMREQCAAKEMQTRSGLAADIVKRDMASRMRNHGIALVREKQLREKANETAQSLQRAQSAKSLREAADISRIRNEAAARDAAREERMARAQIAKENNQLHYMHRNAEEERRRELRLAAVQQKEARQQVELARHVVAKEEDAKKRTSSHAADKLRSVVEQAKQRQQQAERAIQIKVERERQIREETLVKAAEREKARKRGEQRARDMAAAKQRYYAERNMMEEERYERVNEEAFAEGVSRLVGVSNHLGSSLSRSSSATIQHFAGAPPSTPSSISAHGDAEVRPAPGTRRSAWGTEPSPAAPHQPTATLRSSASTGSFEWLMDY